MLSTPVTAIPLVDTSPVVPQPQLMFQQYSCLLVLDSHEVLVQLETRMWCLKSGFLS